MTRAFDPVNEDGTERGLRMEAEGHDNRGGTEVSPDNSSLRDGLVDVFEQARALVAGWLENQGVPPIIPRGRMVVEENEAGNGWSGQHVEVNESVLSEGLVELHMASKKVLAGWAPAALAVAEGLRERFSNTRPRPFPFRPPRLDLIGVDETSLDLTAGDVTDMMIEFVFLFSPRCARTWVSWPASPTLIPSSPVPLPTR